jgi:transglutaminase-like putative cysteine protease
MQLEVRHDTHYEYAAPVSLAHHQAHLRPLQDPHQQLLHFNLDVQPPAAHSRESQDKLGNAQLHFNLTQAHRALRVRAVSRVQLQTRFSGLQPEASPPWEDVAQQLRYVAQSRFEPAVEFALPSPFVPRLQALREYGASSLRPGRPIAFAALDLMQRVFRDFQYQSDSTQVETPLAQVLAQRSGVCQDFAHVMLGALRMWGLPARYVSGYLLTHAPDGESGAGRLLQGADASHAWVQVWCPGTPGLPSDAWLDLDPTNNLVPGSGHVRLAIGRDFGDVTPLRGVIRGGGQHTLTVGVSVRRLTAEELAQEPQLDLHP